MYSAFSGPVVKKALNCKYGTLKNRFLTHKCLMRTGLHSVLNTLAGFIHCAEWNLRGWKHHGTPEPVFLNVYGAQESNPRNEFRQLM